MGRFLSQLERQSLVVREKSARRTLAALSLIASSSDEATYVWRGQDNAEWDPIPGIYRRISESRKIQDISPQGIRWLERQIFDGAGKFTHKIGLDRLAELQHQGAATRLLDVTIDPMAGLWFAVNDERHWQDAGILYAFDSQKMARDPYFSKHGQGALPVLSEGECSEAITDEDRLTLVEVSRDSGRIKAQRGSFIVFPMESGTVDDLDFALKGSDRWSIASDCIKMEDPPSVPPGVIGILIPAEQKPEIKSLLGRAFGYTTTEIYPDFPGYCSANSARSEFDDHQLPRVEVLEHFSFVTNVRAVLVENSVDGDVEVSMTTSQFQSWNTDPWKDEGYETDWDLVLLMQVSKDRVDAVGEARVRDHDAARDVLVLHGVKSEALTAQFKGYMKPEKVSMGEVFICSRIPEYFEL